jgi:hypothetical protein
VVRLGSPRLSDLSCLPVRIGPRTSSVGRGPRVPWWRRALRVASPPTHHPCRPPPLFEAPVDPVKRIPSPSFLLHPHLASVPAAGPAPRSPSPGALHAYPVPPRLQPLRRQGALGRPGPRRGRPAPRPRHRPLCLRPHRPRPPRHPASRGPPPRQVPRPSLARSVPRRLRPGRLPQRQHYGSTPASPTGPSRPPSPSGAGTCLPWATAPVPTSRTGAGPPGETCAGRTVSQIPHGPHSSRPRWGSPLRSSSRS